MMDRWRKERIQVTNSGEKGKSGSGQTRCGVGSGRCKRDDRKDNFVNSDDSNLQAKKFISAVNPYRLVLVYRLVTSGIIQTAGTL